MRLRWGVGPMPSTFGSQGIQLIDLAAPSPGRREHARGLVLQPDGKFVVAGFTESGWEAAQGGFVVRVNSSGSLDATFGTDGTLTFDYFTGTGLALQSDGKLLVPGTAIARLLGDNNTNSDGDVDGIDDAIELYR
jgi:uncharacterized delta-60 repeat protein